MRIAIQMDAIEGINPASDTSLLLGIEATRRGYELFYYTPDKLSYRDGKITARAFPANFFDDANNYYRLGEEFVLELASVDVVLLRQDPPFDMAYLSTTYLLEKLEGKVLVANNPASVRGHPEKLFPMLYREYMPPTLVSADEQEIEEFYKEHKDIVIKPLYGFGGKGILHLKEGDDNFKALLEMMFAESREPIMAQKFLPQVKTEEKRIVLLDGEVAGIIGRIPETGEIRSNLRVGGTAVKSDLSAKQREICEVLKRPLKEKGLVLVGLDVIGDFLTEINITSPTGLRAINNLYGTALEKKFWDIIEAKING